MAETNEIDELTKAWFAELDRLIIKPAHQLTLWEEALLALTIELERTMEKFRNGVECNAYDHFLIDVLQLLVLPGGDHDRERALQKLAEAVEPMS